MKKLIMPILSMLFGFFLLFVGSEVVLHLLPVSEGNHLENVNQEHPILHLEPNRTFTYSKGWNFSLVNKVKSNNEGFVNDVDYIDLPDSPLVTLVGDSYVEAMMIPFQNTVAGRLGSFLK
jgi:hypothetical protein